MMPPVDITKLSENDFKSFIESFDYVFSDCDGVIWAKFPLVGSGKFFSLMEKCGKQVSFVSNNSIRSKEDYSQLFEAANIDNGFERLTIPSMAIVEYLKAQKFDKTAYCVTCTETQRLLEENGIKCTSGPEEIPDYYGDFGQFLQDNPEIGAVIFDSDFKMNIPKMYRAITYLKRPEVLFINGASDRVVLMDLGITAFATSVLIEDIIVKQTGRQLIVLGKPSKAYGQLAMARAKVSDPSKVLFIGDMIEQDVGLGKNSGFITLLVLTHFTEENMMQAERRPDYFAPNLNSITPKIEEYILSRKN